MVTKQNALQDLLGLLSSARPLVQTASAGVAEHAVVPVPAASSPADATTPPASTTGAVDMNALIPTMIDANLKEIDRFVTFLEKIESDMMTAGQGALNGETEELLRLLIQGAQKTIDALITLHERLQTEIIESYFPAQD